MADEDEYEDDFEDDDDVEAAVFAGEGKSAGTFAPTEISFDEVQLGDQLGGGGVSVVYSAVWDGQRVAVKMTQEGGLTDALIAEYRDELLVMQNLTHPNIVRVHGACLKAPRLCLVMELSGPSLHKLLHTTMERFDHGRRLGIAHDVASAMRYLHDDLGQACIHRDIKSANVLIDEVTGDAKLCDFGLSTCATTQAGTPAYMAPELLAGKSFSKAVDVYAFGVLLWELFAEQMPFDGYDIPTVKDMVLAGERPKPPLSCPRIVQRLFNDCWAQTCGERPRFETVVLRIEQAQGAVPGGLSRGGSASSMGSGGGGTPRDALDSLSGLVDSLDMLMK